MPVKASWQSMQPIEATLSIILHHYRYFGPLSSSNVIPSSSKFDSRFNLNGYDEFWYDQFW